MATAMTRIRNNQVYNSDIDAATKLVPGSITGALFNPILSYSGNLTVGNLFINGMTTSLDTTNVVSADPTIALNRNFSGANTYDVGFIMGRGNQTNTALVWNESNKEFGFFYTSATSLNSYYGTIPNSGYANIHAFGGAFNNVNANTSNITNQITSNIKTTGGYIDGTAIGANTANTGVFTSVTTTNGGQLTGYHTGPIGANTANTGVFTSVTTTSGGQLTGYLTGPIGANTANTAAFTTVTASGVITANNTTEATSYSTGGLVVTGGLGVTKSAWIHGNLTIDGNLLVTGNNVTLASVDLTVNDSVINLHTAANLAPWTVNDGKDIGFKLHYFDANVGGDNLGFLGRANDTGYLEWYTTGAEGVGNVFTSGTYGTIKTGDIVLANSTVSTSNTTGALRVSGGIGIAGNIYNGGNIVSSGNINATSNIVATNNISSTTGNINSGSWLIATTNISTPAAKIGCLSASSNTITNWDTSNNININPAGNNGNVVVNSSGYSANLIVQGNTTNGYQNLLVTNGVTGQVGIKKAPDQLTPYASFEINATDTFMMPKGLTGGRPPGGSEQKGMMRYNTSINSVEYWDGTVWNTGGAVFTVITADSFVGNGSQTIFTLTQNTTTSGVIVSVNGLVQIPTVAYNVSGKTLTFTTAPAGSANIDVRTIVTTVSVSSIADGATSINVANSAAVVYAVVQNSNIWVANTSTYFNGGISAFNANTSLTQNTLTTINTFSKTKFRSAKYIVSISDFAGAKYQSAEVLVVHDGSNATAATYGIVSTSGSVFVTYGAIVSGSNVILQANSTSAASYASVQQIYNAV